MLNQFSLIVPEILLTILVLSTQLFAIFYKSFSRGIALFVTFAASIIIFYFSYFFQQHAGFGFYGSFFSSPVLLLLKTLILAFSIMTILIYADLMTISDKGIKMEFISLILLSTLGSFVAVSARDFLLLFCGMELQALSGYVMAAFNVKKIKSSEAGLKYFILGSLISCLMLLGISLLYGFSGSIKFIEVQEVINENLNISLIIGSILIIAAILFKLSAAPLHIWTPDVYEGSPMSAVVYFAVAQKLATIVVLINIIDLVIGNYVQISIDLIRIVSILSMIVGSLGAIMQSSLKRLMAYSTILNIGYVLIGITLHSSSGKYAALLYIIIYIIGVMGFFACLAALLGDKIDEVTFDDIRGIASHRKTIAAAISVIMFSMIGLPPLAGFFGKYYLFYHAVKQGEIYLAIFGVLSSIIAAVYYLKVIRFMYFAEASEPIDTIPTNQGLLLVSIISVVITLFFFAFASTYIL